MTRKNKRILNNTGTQPCEVCEESNYLVQHHIAGRKIKNANSHHNLANICNNCHTKIHKGIIIIEKRALTTNGYKLIWHQNNQSSITGEDSIPYLY